MPARSVIDTLPEGQRLALEREIIAHGFGSYREIEQWVKDRFGVDLSHVSIWRHGSKLERKLEAVKASTRAAALIAEAAPDDADLRSAAVMSLLQTEVFDVLLALQELPDDDDPQGRLKALSHAAGMIAKLSRASVNQKKWEVETRDRIATEASAAAIEEAKAAGLTPDQAGRIGAAVASRIQIYLPDNRR